MTKTGNFEDDTRSGYYRWLRNERYKLRDQPLFQAQLPADSWDDDFYNFLLNQGVPEKYVAKVGYCAYELGHSSGEEEILSYSYNLIDIFK